MSSEIRRWMDCLGAGALVLVMAGPCLAQADTSGDVVRVEPGQFRAGAGRITFRELPLQTANPVYSPQMYGGDASSPTVSFGSYLQGRRLGQPAECPMGAMPTGCLAGEPRTPLSLDLSATGTIILFDGAAQVQRPALSGTPRFNGSIALLFDKDVAAVGVEGGYFDAIGGTGITVYDRQGRVIGRTKNRRIGIEFLGLATSDLSARIAALEFHLVGPEPAGFAIDSVAFGAPDQVDVPNVTPPGPTPARRPPIRP